ncbi:MAG: hypothetical protein JNK63_00540 [Chthonomonas sp.]|nr:hypothetical protein [Chthonomonas sp.]
MANGYHAMSDSTLTQNIAITTDFLITKFADYGLTEAEVEALVATNDAFDSSITASMNADAAKLAATQAKYAERATTLDAMSSFVGKIYANPEVSNEMLAAANLSPRPSHSGARPLVPVFDFLATPSPNGEVRLKWNRSTNLRSVTFVVEAQTGESGPFEFIASTTRTTLTLTGFEPGQMRTFRVLATRGSQTSAPSNLAVIYGEGSYTELPMAA